MRDDQADPEVEDRISANAANLPGVQQLGDANHSRNKNEWRDDHSHQSDECIAQWLHLHCQLRHEDAECGVKKDTDQNLDIQPLADLDVETAIAR
jgi:hypothetical protein